MYVSYGPGAFDSGRKTGAGWTESTRVSPDGGGTYSRSMVPAECRRHPCRLVHPGQLQRPQAPLVGGLPELRRANESMSLSMSSPGCWPRLRPKSHWLSTNATRKGRKLKLKIRVANVDSVRFVNVKSVRIVASL